MLKLTFLVYAPQSMLLGDFKTLADWMTAMVDHMEGTDNPYTFPPLRFQSLFFFAL